MDLWNSDKLYKLAKKIKGLLLNTKQTKRQIGVLLEQARKLLKADKAFGNWRSLNFNDQLPQPTAYNYMTLASFPEDTGNIPESALYILGKAENDLVRDEVFEKLYKQKKVTVQNAKDAIADAKGEKRKTWHTARDENNDDRISNMARELSCMEYHCNKQLVQLVTDRFGVSEVIGWVKEVSSTPVNTEALDFIKVARFANPHWGM